MNISSVCPLLYEASKYVPDSLDLTTDLKAREYWLQCFEELAQRFVGKVELLHPGDISAKTRAEVYRIRYFNILRALKSDPLLLGPDPLSVRILLDINEQYLRENGFTDAWRLQKKAENAAALRQLPQRFYEIDSLNFHQTKWKELCRGLLAGNMFDWGAQAVTDILEKSQEFGLSQALACIQPRPWLIDNLDQWLERLEGPIHKQAAIFVDNAGIDLILGVIPVTRELLKQGTEVFLCANSAPALNDVTYIELLSAIEEAAHLCSVLKESLSTNKLRCYETGQRGPCLDLRNLHHELSHAMSNVDLVIFEGMGRALHTNLYAKLSVDCLKIAVIKNEWLANHLGGKKFSVVCQFEPAPLL